MIWIFERSGRYCACDNVARSMAWPSQVSIVAVKHLASRRARSVASAGGRWCSCPIPIRPPAPGFHRDEWRSSPRRPPAPGDCQRRSTCLSPGHQPGCPARSCGHLMCFFRASPCSAPAPILQCRCSGGIAASQAACALRASRCKGATRRRIERARDLAGNGH